MRRSSSSRSSAAGPSSTSRPVERTYPRSAIESDVAEQAREVLDTGEPKLLTYGISDEDALGVGLPCGGEIDVFVERFE